MWLNLMLDWQEMPYRGFFENSVDFIREYPNQLIFKIPFSTDKMDQSMTLSEPRAKIFTGADVDLYDIEF